MMFLLDTNVLSEMRRLERSSPSVRAWADVTPAEHTFVSAITILEIEQGLASVERRDAGQSRRLRLWLEGHLLPRFEQRILSVDVAVARCCASLHVPDPRAERDALIAATAIVHDLAVVTRNVTDFRIDGLRVVNPWDYSGSA